MPILIREITLSDDSPLAGGRADRCVQQLAGGSRSHVTGLFDHDCVCLNGQLETDPGRTLAAGDHVRVQFEAERRYSPRRRPEKQRHRGFEIVHEDRDIIVVDKSADLLTVPTDAGEPHTLVYRVNEHVRREGRGRGAFLIHRLDRGVSGLLVFGKTRLAAETVQQQFSERKPERRYDAIVAGNPAREEGVFRSYLATGRNLTRYSTTDTDDGELAVTHFRVLQNFSETPNCKAVAHVSVQLETGRRNQIRVQFAEAGHTVIGDRRYSPDQWKGVPWPHKRLALHASTLAFVHPASCELLTFQSPLPTEMVRFFRSIRSPRQRRQ